MNTYRCHKTVEAFEIGDIVGNTIHSVCGEFSVEVEPAFFERHDVNDPGYLVRYEDGYLSWSPKKAFEEGYCETPASAYGFIFDAVLHSSEKSFSGIWAGMKVTAQIVDAPGTEDDGGYIKYEYPVSQTPIFMVRSVNIRTIKALIEVGNAYLNNNIIDVGER